MSATYQGDSPLHPNTHDDEGEVGTATADNRREHVRIRPNDENQLSATLASGSDIRLIDLSRGGAQFECERRFLPNATVSLRLRTRDGEVLITGRVVRSRIIRLASGGLGYLVGVSFSKPLDLDDAAAAPGIPVTPAFTPDGPSLAADQVAAAASGASVMPVPDALADMTGADVPVEIVAPDAVTEQTPPEPAGRGAALAPTEPSADISAEEVLAFEATAEFAPTMLTVTASVDTTSEQLHDMFNGNDW